MFIKRTDLRLGFWPALRGIPVHAKSEPLPVGTTLLKFTTSCDSPHLLLLYLCAISENCGRLCPPWFSVVLCFPDSLFTLHHFLVSFIDSPPIFWNFPQLSLASFSLSLMRIINLCGLYYSF